MPVVSSARWPGRRHLFSPSRNQVLAVCGAAIERDIALTWQPPDQRDASMVSRPRAEPLRLGTALRAARFHGIGVAPECVCGEAGHAYQSVARLTSSRTG